MKRYNILYLEDLDEYFEETVKLASQSGLTVERIKYAEEFIEEFQDNRYDGLLIDAKGLKNEDQAKAEFNVLPIVLNAINSLQSELPYVIISAYNEKVEDQYRPLFQPERLFNKDDKLTDAFDHLRSQINNLPITKLRKKHKQLFEVFDSKILDQNEVDNFINLLGSSVNDIAESKIADKIHSTRRLLENMIKHMYEILETKGDKTINFSSLMDRWQWLSGNPKMNPKTGVLDRKNPNDHFSLSAWSAGVSLIHLCNLTGSHNYEDPPSKYMLGSCINLISYILVSFGVFLKKHNQGTKS
jgi:hypothetical protein